MPGFTSRWTRPSAWAASSAPATWPTRSTARSGLSGAFALEDLAQVEPVDELHDEVEHPVVLAHRQGRDDVGLVERGGDLRLAQEPLAEALVLGEIRDQHLERDLAALGILGQVDGTRRAAADQPHDPVAGDDAPGREDVRHEVRSLRECLSRLQSAATGIGFGPIVWIWIVTQLSRTIGVMKALASTPGALAPPDHLDRRAHAARDARHRTARPHRPPDRLVRRGGPRHGCARRGARHRRPAARAARRPARADAPFSWSRGSTAAALLCAIAVVPAGAPLALLIALAAGIGFAHPAAGCVRALAAALAAARSRRGAQRLRRRGLGCRVHVDRRPADRARHRRALLDRRRARVRRHRALRRHARVRRAGAVAQLAART